LLCDDAESAELVPQYSKANFAELIFAMRQTKVMFGLLVCDDVAFATGQSLFPDGSDSAKLLPW